MAQMLMDLGANVYSEDFEQHFLARAAEFYQARPFPHFIDASMPAAWSAAVISRCRRLNDLQLPTAAMLRHSRGAQQQDPDLALCI